MVYGSNLSVCKLDYLYSDSVSFVGKFCNRSAIDHYVFKQIKSPNIIPTKGGQALFGAR